MKKYLQNAFDLGTLVDVYDELPLWSAPFGLKLLERVEYRPELTVLDIGCGTGFPLTEIAMRLGRSSTVHGLDPWTDALKRVRRKLDAYGIGNVRLIEGLAESIPLEDRSVDLVVSNNGLNNVADLDRALSECSRVARTGAQFLMTMNLDTTMFEFYGALELVLEAQGLAGAIDGVRRHIREKRRPLAEVKALVEARGFNIRTLELDQFDYRFSGGTAMFEHYFIRLAFLDSWIQLLPGDRVESVFAEVETRLNDRAALLGSLKLSIPFVLIDALKA